MVVLAETEVTEKTEELVGSMITQVLEVQAEVAVAELLQLLAVKAVQAVLVVQAQYIPKMVQVRLMENQEAMVPVLAQMELQWAMSILQEMLKFMHKKERLQQPMEQMELLVLPIQRIHGITMVDIMDSEASQALHQITVQEVAETEAGEVTEEEEEMLLKLQPKEVQIPYKLITLQEQVTMECLKYKTTQA